jgi:hypothetical protein
MSRFHVLRSRTRFRRYGGRRLPFSCFALSDSFPTVPRASSPVFMFCAPVLIFGGIEGVGSRFHLLRSQTHFRRYRGRRLLFSCFARPNSFSMVLTASGSVFMFSLPDTFSAVRRVSGLILMFSVRALIFGGIEGVGSRFHVLRSRTRFRLCGGRRVSLSCFALQDSFSRF